MDKRCTLLFQMVLLPPLLQPGQHVSSMDQCKDPWVTEEPSATVCSRLDGANVTAKRNETELTILDIESINITDTCLESQLCVSVVKNNIPLSCCNISLNAASLIPGDVLVLKDRTNHSVTLLWQNPPDSYSKAYNCSFPGESRNTSCTVHISGLLAGENYFMTVYRAILNGSCIVGKPINVTTRPSPVLAIRVESCTVNSLTIGWTPPTDPHSDKYSYQVCLANATFSECSLSCRCFSKSACRVGSLDAGVTYTVTVYSILNNDTRSVCEDTYATTVPNKPKDVRVIAKSNDTHSLCISWTRPEDLNVKNYTYWVSWAGENSLAPPEKNSTKALNFTLNHLQPGNLYVVKMTSCINDVMSDEAENHALTAPLPPKNFRILAINQTVATVSWELPGPAFNGFELQLWEVKKQAKLVKNETFPNRTVRAELSKLTPGTNYTFIVVSLASREDLTINSTGVEINNATKPECVSDVKCQALNGGCTLKVSWTSPRGGVTKFQVFGYGGLTEVQPNKSAVVKNLQPATRYRIQVATIWHSQQVTSEPVYCYTGSAGVIIGVVVALLLFLVILSLLLFYFKRRRRRRKPILEKQKPNVEQSEVLRSVPVSDFPCYCSERFSDSAFGFAKEYQQLQDMRTGQAQTVAQRPENQAKNRYSNVLPYDSSRVLLSLRPRDPSSDYINASYMPGYQKEKEFIAAQGPLTGTLHDFWRMIWEQRITTLVMLTNCVENGRVKCEHYWPLDYTPCTYDDITVSVVTETILPDWTIRDFSIKRTNASEVRLARHYHYTSWSDHGVPQITSAIICFRDLVRQHIEQQQSSGPALIHCSAGVGRTGTFIALDSLLCQAQNEEEIGVFSFVQRMRMNRPLMVQTETQYIFLHQCLLDWMQSASQHHSEKVESTVVYENTLTLQGYEVSRV